MPDFDLSSVPLGVDEEVGGTPASTIRAARRIEQRRHPQQQPEQGLGELWWPPGYWQGSDEGARLIEGVTVRDNWSPTTRY